MRIWFSGPRLLGGLIRPGVSLGKEDLHPRLPSWRRYELRCGLQAAARAKGEFACKEQCDYLIAKALAAGALDRNGEPIVHVHGDRTQCVEQIVEASAWWGSPMTHAQAGVLFDQAMRRRRMLWLLPAAMIAALLLVALAVAALAAPAQYGFSDPPYSYNREYEQCAWPDNGTGRRYRPGYEDRRWCWPECPDAK